MASTSLSPVLQHIRKPAGLQLLRRLPIEPPWKLATALLVVSLAVGGSGLAHHAETARQAPAGESKATPSAAREPALEEEKIRTDRYGDPLPEGALARLGTIRFRQGYFVYRAVFSPDGKTIACAGAGHGLCLWDAATGKQLRRFGQATHVNALALSPDGKLLAAQDKGMPALFEVASGKVLGPLAEAQAGVAALSFAPDGQSLAVARYNGGFAVWNVGERAKTRKRFDKGQPAARCLAFSSDGKLLATGGMDKIIYLWDAATGEERGRLTGHDKEVSSLAFCVDGRTLASTSDEPGIRLWDVAARKSLRVLESKHGTAATVAFARDGKTLASGHSDGIIALWQVKSGEEIRHWRGHDIAVKTLDFAPDGATLVSGAVWSSGPQLWDTATGKEKGPRGGHHEPVDHVSFSPDGRSVLSTGRDKLFLRWDRATGRPSVRFERPVWAIPYYTLSPSGDTVATWAYKDDVIRLWDMATNKERHTLGKFPDVRQQGRIFAPLVFSPDGKLLAFGGLKEHVVIVWDAASGKERQRLKGLQGNIACVAFSPDSKRIAAGTVAAGGNPTIGVWDVASGAKGAAFSSLQPVENLVFSPDGRVLASSYWNGPMHLWNGETGQELRQLSVAPAVYGLAFSPDGGWLAGAGADRDQKIHVWEVNSGQEVRRFEGHISGAMSVAFAPDGRSLVSGGADSTILLWDVTGRQKRDHLQAMRWTPPELEQRWKDLASRDGPRAVQALWDLVASAEQTVPLLRQRLKPAEPANAQRVEQLIRDLDSDDFETRTKATEELEKIVDGAEPALRKKLTEKPSLEMRQRIRDILSKLEPSASAERLRGLRAVQVLEYAGTPEAKKCLETLADGVPEARLTREAKAALRRLAK